MSWTCPDCGERYVVPGQHICAFVEEVTPENSQEIEIVVDTAFDEPENARPSSDLDEGRSLYEMLEEYPAPKWMILELNVRSTLSALKTCADYMSQDTRIPDYKRDRFQHLLKLIDQAEEECWPQ